MYYEEKVIDGVLHWRSTPDGEWTAFTAQELTERLARLTRDVIQAVLNHGIGSALWTNKPGEQP